MNHLLYCLENHKGLVDSNYTFRRIRKDNNADLYGVFMWLNMHVTDQIIIDQIIIDVLIKLFLQAVLIIIVAT